MFKNKIAIPTLVLLFLTAASVAKSSRDNNVKVSFSEIKASDTSVVIEKDSLFYDTLSLSLKEIPRIQNMYTVANQSIGKWANLFIAIKIVESGNEGDNSIYARRDFNLTGMRQPRARKTMSLGISKHGYATFANWHDCMLDFGMYLDGMERGYKKKFHKSPNSKQMLNYIFGKYNSNQIWKNRTLKVLNNFKWK